MKLKYNQVLFVMTFPTEKLEAFLEGHVKVFEYLGRVSKGRLYDKHPLRWL